MGETCFASTTGYEKICDEDALIIDYIVVAALRTWKKIMPTSLQVFHRTVAVWAKPIWIN